MKILLSNDDGVLAPGLSALASELAKIAEVTVVAPDRNRSGASNSLTLANPLRVQQLSNGFYSVAGTPTDCVHLALAGLLAEKPDLVISGVNAGANLGDDVFYSGTVAAAMEGRFMGLPSMAISLTCESSGNNQNYETAAIIARLLAIHLSENSLPAKTILNVNVPDIPQKMLKGFAITRLGTRHNAEPIFPAMDPRGEPFYWIGPAGAEQDAGPGTDFYAIKHGEISLTPIQLDLTHYAAFEHLAKWTSNLQSPVAN